MDKRYYKLSDAAEVREYWESIEQDKDLSHRQRAEKIKNKYPNIAISKLEKYTGWRRLRYWLKSEEERNKIKESQAKYRNQFKSLITKVKKDSSGCLICGYNKCLEALEFHHIDPKEKEGNISKIKNIDRLNKEIDKCVLLCANCHREFHAGLITQEEINKTK